MPTAIQIATKQPAARNQTALLAFFSRADFISQLRTSIDANNGQKIYPFRVNRIKTDKFRQVLTTAVIGFRFTTDLS